MSELGQTEKNSVRAYVFRFALELGHCSTQSACLKCAANNGHSDSFPATSAADETDLASAHKGTTDIPILGTRIKRDQPAMLAVRLKAVPKVFWPALETSSSIWGIDFGLIVDLNLNIGMAKRSRESRPWPKMEP
jgi:hypothetical protein